MFLFVGRRQAWTAIGLMACLLAACLYRNASVWATARGGTNPKLVWYVATEEPVIALTFDDGPDPKYTPAVLDLLKQYGARATFFVIGRNAEQYPGVLKRIAAEGHEIGNHTFSHRYNLPNLPEEQIVDQVQRAADAVSEICGAQTRVFRPPGGAYNPHLISAVRRLGYDIILWTWSTNPSDAYSPGVDRIVQRATQSALPGDIVLLHEGVNNGQTLKALPKILDILDKRGFKFVTVSRLLALRKTSSPTPP